MNVTNVNETPSITSGAIFTAAENQTAIGSVAVTDPEGATLTYSVSGDELEISSSGLLTFKNAPDYETKSSYTATVTVSDGTNSATQDITVNVTNVNETPSITSGAIFTAAENQTAIGSVAVTDPEGATLTYSVSGDELEISSSGLLTFKNAPDYETKSSYTATVTVSDGTNIATQDITVNVTNLNDNTPQITSSATFTAEENQTAIGSVTATDADGNTSFTYSLSGTDSSSLAISSSGVLTFVTAPDFETKSTYTATVTVSDGTNSATQDITVNVTNVDENAPIFTSSPTFTAYENQTAIGTVKATDADGDALLYSVSGTELAIDSNGLLTFATAPDYETKSRYTATVTVSDGTSSATQDITVNVKNVNDNTPIITSGEKFDNISENQTAIGRVIASDRDGNLNTLTYSITGTELAISSTGVLTFVTVPNYETKNIYTETVTVSDGTNSATQIITVNVTNINDNMPIFTSSAIFNNILENQKAIGTVTASDADGDALLYSVSGSELEFVDPSSGVLTFVTAPDYETKSSYTETVTVTDGTNSNTQDITVNVKNVNDNKPTFTSSAVFNAEENKKAIGTVKATDGDNDTLVYFVDGTELEIGMTSGVLTFKNAPIYKVKSTYEATVTVSDGLNTATQDIEVKVKTVPVVTTTPPTDAIVGNRYIYNITVSNVDGETVTVTYNGPRYLSLGKTVFATTTNYVLSGIPTANDVGNSNVVLTITAGNITTTQSFTIVVIKNDPPVFTSTPVTEARQESLYTYNVTTSDEDNDNVTVSATKIPTFLSFNGTTLSGTPSRSIWGEYDVVLTASDGYENVNQEFKIMVRKPICFNAGTGILCFKNGEEQYVCVEQLMEGDQVKTFNHGYKKIVDIRKGNFKLNGLMDMGMYRMKKQGNMIADLEMSGLHCVLVDSKDPKYVDDIKRQRGLNNKKFFIDEKFRLRAKESHEFEQMEAKEYTIFSFALEDQEQEQYGTWANGVLVETTSRKMLEVSNMIKIGKVEKEKRK